MVRVRDSPETLSAAVRSRHGGIHVGHPCDIYHAGHHWPASQRFLRFEAPLRCLGAGQVHTLAVEGISRRRSDIFVAE